MCGTDVKKALMRVGITIIPCLNPDGREIAVKGFETAKNLRLYLSDIAPEGHSDWKANALGVSIAHNFGRGREQYRQTEYEKNRFSPCAAGCSGEYAESEAETRTLTRLCRLRAFSRCLSLFTDRSGLFLFADENTPANASMMGKILADSCLCPFGRLSAEESAAELHRWFSEEFSRPAFVLGIGDSKTKSSYTDLYKVYNRIEEALLLFLLM